MARLANEMWSFSSLTLYNKDSNSFIARDSINKAIKMYTLDLGPCHIIGRMGNKERSFEGQTPNTCNTATSARFPGEHRPNGTND